MSFKARKHKNKRRVAKRKLDATRKHDEKKEPGMCVALEKNEMVEERETRRDEMERNVRVIYDAAGTGTEEMEDGSGDEEMRG